MDKQLINIVLNELLRSYKMIIQGNSYMTNPTYEDVMGKILTKIQCMTTQNQKLGQKEALSTTHYQTGHFCGPNLYFEDLVAEDVISDHQVFQSNPMDFLHIQIYLCVVPLQPLFVILHL